MILTFEIDSKILLGTSFKVSDRLRTTHSSAVRHTQDLGHLIGLGLGFSQMVPISLPIETGHF